MRTFKIAARVFLSLSFLQKYKVLQYFRASLIAQLVKNLPVMQETLVQFLGWEDPLENGKAIIPVFWPGEFHGLYSPWCCTESDTTEQLSHFTLTSLAYSFLHLFFFFHLFTEDTLTYVSYTVRYVYCSCKDVFAGMPWCGSFSSVWKYGQISNLKS